MAWRAQIVRKRNKGGFVLAWCKYWNDTDPDNYFFREVKLSPDLTRLQALEEIRAVGREVVQSIRLGNLIVSGEEIVVQ